MGCRGKCVVIIVLVVWGIMAVAVDKTPNAPVDMVNRGVLAVL
jgi:hypothetical protein